jgi:hypothetical protein
MIGSASHLSWSSWGEAMRPWFWTLLVNAWELALSPTSPVWAANKRLRHRDAVPRRRWRSPFVKVGLEVTVTNGAPTGQVFNGTPSFQVSTPLGLRPAVFIFESLTGDLTGWTRPTGRPRWSPRTPTAPFTPGWRC